ncbi:hypothetical protein HUK80_11440 [Flavobacterium sp. MAH-1]|uniref:Rieske domain-containing protein n=1 Tax=Flavobacterium agri TaxID=2743471 RepID=A0A7Y9C7N6_9FLAO|nr:hypothetical protein [Flavobacterium agri]NUY81513.1 hypothetical protein [Flavobacterium agri]NYA71537.1 hypothetical protein [Flavobacterium agri]
MKRFLPLLLIVFLFGCDDSNFNNHNPYIANQHFSVDVNLSLPAYNDLNYPGNAAYVGGTTARGIYVFCISDGNYTAYDAACPNQAASSCSTLQKQGIVAVCPCDDAEYNFYTGRAPGMEYPMKPYRVQYLGGVVRVYN